MVSLNLIAMHLYRMTRRSFVQLPAGAALSVYAFAQRTGNWTTRLEASASRVAAPSGEVIDGVRVVRKWQGRFCALSLENRSGEAVRIGEVTAFDVRHGLPPDTPLYAESYQMLAQTGGTLGKPEQIGNYTDAKHYRLPEPSGAFTAYNLISFERSKDQPLLLAFTSCKRFNGKFHLRPETIEIALDGDGLELAAGQSLPLEEFAVFEDGASGTQYADLATRLAKHHPPIFGSRPPQGWCSWYCFGPSVTAQQVMANLDFIAKNMPSLRYIQIDDGYQPAMGDWLETGKAFGGDVQSVLKQIRQRGFEPAIWVAPFIAEADSKLFKEHPGWFMKDEKGEPLPSNRVTFGGWRKGPWFALDGSHPEARAHLEKVFATMRKDWGVTYFKLDANFWGTMPAGRLHDPKFTRVEAYRRGMEAIRRGAGDAFILGCNHPLWPSLGLIHGSRSSGDISRRWVKFKQTARENLSRGWQNGKLWWNDPDVVLLNAKRTSTDERPPAENITDDEFRFHASVIYASGGMLLSGDDLPGLSPARLEMLRKLSPPLGRAVVFEDRNMNVGIVPGKDVLPALFFFNWDDQRITLSYRASRLVDFWTGAKVETPGNVLRVEMPPRSARIFRTSGLL